MNAITESVQKYISNINIKQALLIDGEWGCGKTYFVKNELMSINEIASDAESPLLVKYVYISLFGIDSIKKLMTKINSELLFIFGKEIPRKITRSDKEASKVDTTEISPIKQKIQEKFKTITSIVQNKFLTEDMCQAIFETWDIKLDSQKRYVLIFDDLERTIIDMDMLMGTINQLVEHNNFRIIIVAHTGELASDKATVFSTKKEKVVGATLRYKPDPAETISSIISALNNVTDNLSVFLNSEIYPISQICKIANIFNARSIQRAIAVFSQFYDLYSRELAETTISAVFRGLVFLVLLFDKGYLKEKEFDVFKEYPWNTFKLSGSKSMFQMGLEGENKTKKEQSLTPEEERTTNVGEIIRNYPYETNYPIPESVIQYLSAGNWSSENEKADCTNLNDLTKIINDALSKIVNIRFFEYESLQQMKAATTTICKNIRAGEYQMNLIYRISRAFEVMEVYDLIPNLHKKLKSAVLFWIKNTPTGDMCKRHIPLELHEHRNLNTLEKPEYTEINGILDDLYKKIYYKQTVDEYEDKCNDLGALIRSEYIINLLLHPEFAEVICRKVDEKRITLSDVNTLMVQFGKGKQIYLECAQHEENKQIHDSLERILSSLNRYILDEDDNLWLFYLVELQKRIQERIEYYKTLPK
ncbi:MAG: hypothetical protein JW811_01855 [Clostridiales bacterium]|nr:hypothetical protein [Clostridiales bacterium]